MKQNLLICGGTGFIGRNLVEYYSRQGNYNIKATHFKREAYDAEGVSWIRSDLCNPEDVRRALEGADIVIQAAATTSGSRDIVERPYIHVTDNAVMNSLLLRASYDAGVKHFIFFSCTIMYPSSDTPLKEEDLDLNLELQKNYFGAGWTKIYIERMCEFYSRLGRTAFTVLRHSNIYGPYDKYDPDRSHVFGATVAKVLNASDRISVWGSGLEKRDWMYVDDLMQCVDQCIASQKQPFALYNAGLGQAFSVNDLVALLLKASGKNLPVEHDTSRPSIPTSIQIDCTRIQQQTGWRPLVSLDEGVQRTLKWYSENYLQETSK
jgi:GDP-L-fucose synthase